MTTKQKNTIIDEIKIFIEDLQGDIQNKLNKEDEISEMKLDLDSLKTVLGHLITLKTF
jgi:hypothetical protein